ncbi:MAG: DUF4177 domain-containing protein [Rhodobacteraceae bacterium]|nr:DUF4177 domain-containing protein [Paracoccaceae bacterium]
MQSFEYKAIAAPTRARKFKGVKGTAAQFAMVLSELMNEMASDGWEYLRSDSLPVDEKAGLLKARVETYHTMLIFRRAKSQPAEMAGLIEDHSAEPEITPKSSPPFEPAAPARPAEDYGFSQDPPMTSDARHAEELADEGGPFSDDRR